MWKTFSRLYLVVDCDLESLSLLVGGSKCNSIILNGFSSSKLIVKVYVPSLSAAQVINMSRKSLLVDIARSSVFLLFVVSIVFVRLNCVSTSVRLISAALLRTLFYNR